MTRSRDTRSDSTRKVTRLRPLPNKDGIIGAEHHGRAQLLLTSPPHGAAVHGRGHGDLPAAVIAAGQAAGLTPVERCVAVLAGLRDDRLVARPSFFQLKNVRTARAAGGPMHLIVHEDVLVFRRPKPQMTDRENRTDTAHGRSA